MLILNFTYPLRCLRLPPVEYHCSEVQLYDGVSKSFRTARLERELQMVQLSATRCNYIAIL
jgi:hypothetical protein